MPVRVAASGDRVPVEDAPTDKDPVAVFVNVCVDEIVPVGDTVDNAVFVVVTVKDDVTVIV